MNIVTAVRCLNEIRNIDRFLKGYDFSDSIIISDGGSIDGSIELIQERQKTNPKIHLIHFSHHVVINGEYFNEDAPHMNYVLDAAKELNPDFLLFDDMDCCPTKALRENARNLIIDTLNYSPQINAFRLYLWGYDMYFPHMLRDFDPDYSSLWGWSPRDVDIRADENVRHGTLVGLIPDHRKLGIPFCLLHASWHPETIQAKVDRYNALDLPMTHPTQFAGEAVPLPEWAVE